MLSQIKRFRVIKIPTAVRQGMSECPGMETPARFVFRLQAVADQRSTLVESSSSTL